MIKPDGGPAFPFKDYKRHFGPGSTPLQIQGASGMALRDYFAAAALMGPLAELTGTAEQHAADAYEYADAMLAEREKE